MNLQKIWYRKKYCSNLIDYFKQLYSLFRLEAIEEVLVARQEYLMNAYNVIEEEKHKHEEEQLKKINPKVGALNPVLNKAAPAAGGKLGIQGKGKPKVAFKPPVEKMQMAKKLTQNFGGKT